jgi:transposase
MGKKSFSHDTRVEILTLYKLGTLSYEEIANKCDVSSKCVFTTVTNYQENGNIDEKKRSGRPRKTTSEHDNRLFHLIRDKPNMSCRSLSVDAINHRIPIISHQTVARRLKEFQLESHFAATKPLLTEFHKQKRLNWCLDKQNWGYEKWASIIFSDESNYMLTNRKTNRRVWRLDNEKYDEKFVKKVSQGGGGSIGVWGCIAQQGAGCCATFPGRLNSERYLELLENNLMPSLELLKSSDNDWLACNWIHH